MEKVGAVLSHKNISEVPPCTPRTPPPPHSYMWLMGLRRISRPPHVCVCVCVYDSQNGRDRGVLWWRVAKLEDREKPPPPHHPHLPLWGKGAQKQRGGAADGRWAVKVDYIFILLSWRYLWRVEKLIYCRRSAWLAAPAYCSREECALKNILGSVLVVSYKK